MIKLYFVFIMFPIFVDGGSIYIERHDLESNKKYNNWSVSYCHDEKHNAVVNLSIEFFVAVSKILLYFDVTMAEDQNDNEYRRPFIKTVINVEKCFKGMQANVFMRTYLEILSRYMDFNITFPLGPVSATFLHIKKAVIVFFSRFREPTDLSTSLWTPNTFSCCKTPEALLIIEWSPKLQEATRPSRWLD